MDKAKVMKGINSKDQEESKEKAVRRTYNIITKYVRNKEAAIKDVAKSTGVKEDKVREIIRRYNGM